ncbi:hypothetical protein [Bacillus sp. AK128]
MKKGLIFGLGYFLFIIAIISIGIFYSTLDIPKQSPANEATQTKLNQSFDEALKEHQEKIEEKKKNEDPNKWKPSSSFVLTAVSLGAIADIVIVILWARHENRKKESGIIVGNKTKKRITESAIFWWIIGLGIVRKKNDRLVIDWKYIVVYLLLGLLVKVWITKELV